MRPLQVGYDPIPDEEDVTPYNRPIAKQTEGSYSRLIWTFILVMAGIIALGTYSFKTSQHLFNNIKLYQTSVRHGDALTLLNAKDLAARGFDVGTFGFGNTVCNTLQTDMNICNPPPGITVTTNSHTHVNSYSSGVSRIYVDRSQEYQSIVGFGGAFTEASAHNFHLLPEAVQKKVITMYFDPEDGIGLTLGRVHINSCDFSLASYSFDNVPGDIDLLYFDHEVTHDQVEMLPFMRQAAAACTKDKLRILASPWSPPGWMKIPHEVHAPGSTDDTTPGPTSSPSSSDNNSTSNNANSNSNMTSDVFSTLEGESLALYDQTQATLLQMLGSADPNGLNTSEVMQRAWATYISHFISAYAQQGVKIWAITPQNEPEFAAPWEACKYTPTFEMEFITHHLGPKLRDEHPDVLLLAFDHNKDDLVEWTRAAVRANGHTLDDSLKNVPGIEDDDRQGHKDDDPAAGAISFDGDGQHVSRQLRTSSNHTHAEPSSPVDNDKTPYVNGMAFHWYTGSADRELDGTYGYNNIREAHKLAPDMMLLATEGCSCPGVALGDLKRAERLGHDVLFDLNNFAQGWIDWNLIVDSQGGPNHLNNFCDASIVTNPDYSDILTQPKYHYFGHFSKFVRPGSVRINSKVVGDFKYENSDPKTRAGIELGLFPCEHSSRQKWIWRSDGGLQLAHPVKFYQDGVPYLISLCVGTGDNQRTNLRLVVCDSIVTDDVSSPTTGLNGTDIDNSSPTNMSDTTSTNTYVYKDDPIHANTNTAADANPETISISGEHFAANTQLHFSLLDDGQFVVEVTYGTTTDSNNHTEPNQQTSHRTNNQLCLSQLTGSADDSGSGSLLTLTHCRLTIDAFVLSATQELILTNTSSIWRDVNTDPNKPKLVKSSPGDLCLTAGWPFLTAAAFTYSKPEDSGKTTGSTLMGATDDDKDKTIVVIMNEANIPTTIVLTDSVRGDVWFGIPERSIQTIVY